MDLAIGALMDQNAIATARHASLRPELTPLPPRIARLPLSQRGYPVPWFVPWIDGEPEFVAMDDRKRVEAVRFKKCWVCGEKLGRHLAFVIGPMCGINRTTSEPPSHLDCARWSACNCPFLTQRQEERREHGLPEHAGCPGVGLKRNPGVALVWVTDSFRPFSDGKGSWLIRVGDPQSVEFYSHGRTATRAEIEASIDSGLPLLLEACKGDVPEAVTELMKQKREFEQLLPLE